MTASLNYSIWINGIQKIASKVKGLILAIKPLSVDVVHVRVGTDASSVPMVYNEFNRKNNGTRDNLDEAEYEDTDPISNKAERRTEPGTLTYNTVS